MGIQQMRDNTQGIIAKIIVGLIIVVFALFGFGSITTFLAPVAKVATVNGSDITQQQMELAVERNRRIMLAQNVSPQDIDEDALRSNVQCKHHQLRLGLACTHLVEVHCRYSIDTPV